MRQPGGAIRDTQLKVAKIRTTLTIDDDALAKAREIAARQRKNVDQVISDLARQTFSTAPPVTLALINQLRDELP